MIIKQRLHRLAGWAALIYRFANRSSGGGLEVLWLALRQFLQNQSSDAAASLAFYAFFSLFPLLAVVVTVLSFFANEDRLLKTLVQFLIPIFPVSQGLIAENLRRFIDLRGTIGVIGTIGLIWAASSVFTILVRNINRAWTTARTRSFFHARLTALAVIGGMLGLLLLAQVGSSLLDLIATIRVPTIGGFQIPDSWISGIVTQLLPPVLTFFIFVMLYRYIPNTQVRWREAFWGALVVTVLWEITSRVFTWYIESGLAYYDVLYGSLATLTVLMFWFYLNSLILLYGAYISSAIAQRKTDRETEILVDDRESVGVSGDGRVPGRSTQTNTAGERSAVELPGKPPTEK